MPAALPFDTLDYARKLEAAGVPSEQAELQARALNDALASSVASRDDLTNLEHNLDGKFAHLESRVDARFVNLESRLDARFVNLESRLDARFANVDARFENVDARLASLESRFNAKVDNLESSLHAKIANLKNELQLELRGKIEILKWMFGTLVVLNGAMLVQLLLRH
jgi:hypothetical protein